MPQLFDNLLAFQVALVRSSLSVACVGILLIGFGFVISGTSIQLGYRLRRIGLQSLAAVTIALMFHAISVRLFNGMVPVPLLLGTYAILGMLLLQSLLNLAFGAQVGNSVISRLLSGIILMIIGLLVAEYLGLFSLA